MKRLSLLLVAPLAAACTQSPAPPIPSAPLDDNGGSVARTLVHQRARPCGYTIAYDSGDASGSTHSDGVDTMLYDAAGRVVAEHAVDAHTGAKVWDDTWTYDAAGNWLTFVDQRFDGTPDESDWSVYDAFERLIRYSGDQNGDGKEDWVATYAYGGDGRRVSAHLVLPSVTYDRAYHYGPDGRLTEIERDNGPDGHVDMIYRYTYDDDARTEAYTVTDPGGKDLGHGQKTYDEANRMISADDVWVETGDTAHNTEHHVFDGDREASTDWATHYTLTDGSISFFSDALVWRYGGCN